MSGYMQACFSIFFILLICGCTTTLPPGRVTVIRVERTQIPFEAVRTHWANGKWSIYLSDNAGPEVLRWELEQIRLGTEWDRI